MISVTVRYLFTHHLCFLVIFSSSISFAKILLMIKSLSLRCFDNLEVTTVTIRLPFPDDRRPAGVGPLFFEDVRVFICFPSRYSLFTPDNCLPDLPQISICHLIYSPWWHPESRISGIRRKTLQPGRSRTQDSLSSTRRGYHVVLTDLDSTTDCGESPSCTTFDSSDTLSIIPALVRRMLVALTSRCSFHLETAARLAYPDILTLILARYFIHLPSSRIQG